MSPVLPDACLHRILCYVPLKERLGSCSLVSRRFQAVAAAATERIEASDVNYTQRPSGLAWILAYGSSLTSLELHDVTQLVQLPCSRLRWLDLRGCDGVRLPDVLQGCPALTGLSLQSCTYLGLSQDSSRRYNGLTVLQDLQALTLWEDGDSASLGRFDSSLWCGLVQLTKLHVFNVVISPESLQHISKLTALRDCNLSSEPRTGGALELGPSVALPVSLRALDLLGVRMDPSAVLHLTRLQELRLGHLAAVSSTDGLLALPARLPALEAFVLNSSTCLDWPASPAAYSALFVNSRLQQLSVRDCGVPWGMWDRVFPADARLPRLQQLVLHEAQEESRHWFPTCARNTSAVARACPALENLTLGWLPRRDPQQQVAALAQLSALTFLWVHSVFLNPAEQQACMQALATLTDLRGLHLGGFRTDVTPGLLLPLTALQGLETLFVFGDPLVCLVSAVRRGAEEEQCMHFQSVLVTKRPIVAFEKDRKKCGGRVEH